MIFRTAGLLALAVAPLAWTQDEGGPVIQHDAVGCLVAEKYPRLAACVTPAAELARARVYFRAGADGPWYYVEMSPAAPCLEGILPKPKRTAVSVEYYIAALGRDFRETRTESHSARVGESAFACGEGAAPFVGKATVTVGSTAAGASLIPAGFAAGGVAGAGASAAAVAAVVGSGAAAVGGIAATTGGEPSSTTTTRPAAAATTTTTTTTTTTMPPAANQPPELILFVHPNPPQGESPLRVGFDLCRSTDPDGDRLRFAFFFGDGEQEVGGRCRADHVYRPVLPAPGPSASFIPPEVYAASVCIQDPTHEPVCRPVRVVVQPKVFCRFDKDAPLVRLSLPQPGTFTDKVPLDADVRDNVGVRRVVFEARELPAGLPKLIAVRELPPFRALWDPPPRCDSDFAIRALAIDECRNAALSAPVTIRLQTDQKGPGVAITSPAPGALLATATVDVKALADDPSGVSAVEFVARQDAGAPVVFATDTTAPFEAVWTVPCNGSFVLQARAEDACGNTRISEPVSVVTAGAGTACLSALGGVVIASDLQAGTATGVLSIDNGPPHALASGLVWLKAAAAPGEHQVEATLTSAPAKGRWRFELTGIVPGSLRVLAGEPLLVTGEALVFALHGDPTRRVSFTYRSPQP